MITSILNNERLVDNRIDIKFEDKIVTIYRVTALKTVYSENGIDVLIEGDFSPNENGTFKCRSFEVFEHFMEDVCKDVFTYKYKCDYDNTFICSKKLTSFTVSKYSNDRSYFNRLSQKD